jgi:hypothetical protein
MKPDYCHSSLRKETYRKINIVLLTREAAKKINEKRTGRSGIKIIKIQSRSSEKERG